MRSRVESVKQVLEILGIVVGLSIGAVTLWQYLPHEPPLVGEVLVAPARPSPETIAALRDMPKKFFTSIASNPKLSEQVHFKDLPAPLRSYIEEEMAKEVDILVGPSGLLPEKLAVCDIHNRSEKTLYGVQLRPHFFRSKTTAVLTRDIHQETEVASTGTVDIGDLRPDEDVQVLLWQSLLFSETEFKLSHRDGIGSLRYYRPVPRLVALGGGTWLSFGWVQPALTAVLAVLLAAWSWTSRRKKVPPSHP